MGISQIAAVIAAISLGWLPLSCNKAKPAAAKSSPDVKAAAATPSKTKDLGEITLTNHFETLVDIGSGKSCRITSKLLDRKSLQLTLALESKQSNGKTSGLSVAQAVTRPGQPFDITVGDVDLTMTPNFVDNN